MALNPLISRWRAGQPTLGAWMTTTDGLAAELLAGAGFDEVCVDQQHGFADSAALAALFRAIELHGAAPTTRVPANDFAAIGKALDVGALAVVVPLVETPAEAARAARACHYPPRGNRSAGALRGGLVRAAGRTDELEQVACVVMIETAKGLANVDAIAGTPGVDAVYVGPGDLALGLGLPAWDDERSATQRRRHEHAIERIRAACERASVAAGIHCADGASARRFLDQGFLMVTVTSDLTLLHGGARAELEAARSASAAHEAAAT